MSSQYLTIIPFETPPDRRSSKNTRKYHELLYRKIISHRIILQWLWSTRKNRQYPLRCHHTRCQYAYHGRQRIHESHKEEMNQDTHHCTHFELHARWQTRDVLTLMWWLSHQTFWTQGITCKSQCSVQEKGGYSGWRNIYIYR